MGGGQRAEEDGGEAVKLFTCVDHDGVWPVGVASVVVAGSEDEARDLLKVELRSQGLDSSKPFTLSEISAERPRAFVLMNGDY